MPGMCNQMEDSASEESVAVTADLIDLLKQRLVYRHSLKVLGLISYSVDDQPDEKFFKVEFAFRRPPSDSHSEASSPAEGEGPVGQAEDCCNGGEFPPPPAGKVLLLATGAVDSVEAKRHDRRKSRKPRRQVVPSCYSSDEAAGGSPSWQEFANVSFPIDSLDGDDLDPTSQAPAEMGEECRCTANDLLPTAEESPCNTSDESQSCPANNNNNIPANELVEEMEDEIEEDTLEEEDLDGANCASSAGEETDAMMEDKKEDDDDEEEKETTNRITTMTTGSTTALTTTTTATLVGLAPQLANGLALLSQGTYNILPGPFSFISATPLAGCGTGTTGTTTLLKGLCTTVAAAAITSSGVNNGGGSSITATSRPSLAKRSSGRAGLLPSSGGVGTGLITSLSKAYKCRYCGKIFNRKFCRERHERLHTGVKPYNCDVCGEKFIRLEDKKRHVRSAHPAARDRGGGSEALKATAAATLV